MHPCAHEQLASRETLLWLKLQVWLRKHTCRFEDRKRRHAPLRLLRATVSAPGVDLEHCFVARPHANMAEPLSVPWQISNIASKQDFTYEPMVTDMTQSFRHQPPAPLRTTVSASGADLEPCFEARLHRLTASVTSDEHP